MCLLLYFTNLVSNACVVILQETMKNSKDCFFFKVHLKVSAFADTNYKRRDIYIRPQNEEQFIIFSIISLL